MVVGSLTADRIVAAQGDYTYGLITALVCLYTMGHGRLHSVFHFRSRRIKPDSVRRSGRRIGNCRGSHDRIFRVQIRHIFHGRISWNVAISGPGRNFVPRGWHAPAHALEFIPSYVWFFAKLSALLFVYVWVRGTLPRTRIDQMMNFAWKFMLPMAFTCIVAAAVWHYAGRGLRGWLWSLLVDSNCLQCLVDFARYEKKIRAARLSLR